MFKQNLKRIIPRFFIYFYRQIVDTAKWLMRGRTVPTPQIVKQLMIRGIVQKSHNHIFVETGTYLGDTVYFLRNLFKKIISIELDHKLYEKALKRFGSYDHIKILQGDSGELIQKILNYINEPCIFWLDGHYSGDITAKGALSTPIFNELTAIFNHKRKDHIILVDDARCFDGTNDYPRIEYLIKFINEHNPLLKITIMNDVIVII